MQKVQVVRCRRCRVSMTGENAQKDGLFHWVAEVCMQQTGAEGGQGKGVMQKGTEGGQGQGAGWRGCTRRVQGAECRGVQEALHDPRKVDKIGRGVCSQSVSKNRTVFQE
jgi:hypothetical protein